jgi:hypothetical protein
MTVATIDRETIRRILVEELPRAIEEDTDFRYWLTGWMAETFPRRSEVEQSTAQILEQLAALRQDFNRQMALQAQRIEALEQRMDAFEQRMEDLRQDFNQRMEDLRRDFNQRMEDLRPGLQLADSAPDGTTRIPGEAGGPRICAIGGHPGGHRRSLGLMAEESFRSGMAGILRDEFGWQVEHVLIMDTEGYVFGRPDQVEIDIAIHDGAIGW